VLRVLHTAELDATTVAEARALLRDAFEGDWTDTDWEHSLGGLHVVVREEGRLVGHASLVARRLLHAGRSLRAGYVEAVAVRADRRRQGIGDRLMDHVERLVRSAYDLGALSTTDLAEPFYANRGWQQWRGPTSVVAPGGIRRTPEDDGGVYVLPVSLPLDLEGALACDWREGDVW
jgi:aminoglycoside 2'-N-acetyltransferase I